MSTWLLVWFLVAILSTAAVTACLVALVRHVIVLGRAARQLPEAVTPLAAEIGRERTRATSRAASLRPPGSRARGESAE